MTWILCAKVLVPYHIVTDLAIDTTKPVITLQPEVFVIEAAPELEYSSAQEDNLVVFATDTFDEQVMIVRETTDLRFDLSRPAEFSVMYKASDSGGNSASATRIVRVVDTTPPSITLTEGSTIQFEMGKVFLPTDFSAIDSVDGAVSVQEPEDFPDNSTIEGTYTVYYTATDLSDNLANVSRVVVIVEQQLPFIQVQSPNFIVIEAGHPFVIPTARVRNSDGGSTLTNASDVDTAIVGTYSVNYTSVNPNLNATIVVKVVDTTPPVST